MPERRLSEGDVGPVVHDYRDEETYGPSGRTSYPTRPTYCVASNRSVRSSGPATVNSHGAFRNWNAR